LFPCFQTIGFLGFIKKMEQPGLFPTIAVSVSELTHYVRTLLEGDEILQDIWVQGEISNLSQPHSRHVYFTLKDAEASLRCVIWRPVAAYIPVTLRDGLSIEVHGSIGVYEKGGQYQLYVNAVRRMGEGLLYQEFLRLKARLEAEGLFDEARKRPIPERPRVIGVVTSPTGAALQDVLNTLRQRYPLAEVVLSPTSVQGDAAPPEIVEAIELINRKVHPDVLLLVRGGGSLEDLWAFNDERVVRAVVASEAPVITGVGHETDFTLVDFASDLRAPTPTGAAMLASPAISEIWSELDEVKRRLEYAMEEVLDEEQARLRELGTRLELVSPSWRVRNGLQRLDELNERLLRAGAGSLRLRQVHLQSLHNRLGSLNPLAVLKRGFAVVQRPDGSLVLSIRQVASGDEVGVRLSDGKFDARVEEISEDG
jgi:exodeoxyribonuclease VII large subunit